MFGYYKENAKHKHLILTFRIVNSVMCYVRYTDQLFMIIIPLKKSMIIIFETIYKENEIVTYDYLRKIVNYV